MTQTESELVWLQQRLRIELHSTRLKYSVLYKFKYKGEDLLYNANSELFSKDVLGLDT